jgi:hypothetical protein
LNGKGYSKHLGHGRVYIGIDDLPAALIWGMVDDFFVHGPTKEKCGEAFSRYGSELFGIPPYTCVRFDGQVFCFWIQLIHFGPFHVVLHTMANAFRLSLLFRHNWRMTKG